MAMKQVAADQLPLCAKHSNPVHTCMPRRRRRRQGRGGGGGGGGRWAAAAVTPTRALKSLPRTQHVRAQG